MEAQQIDLAALGFRPGSLTSFGIAPGTFPTIVKVNTAEAQISMNQQLFNVPAYYLYRSAQKAAYRGELFDAECARRSDAGSGDAVSAGAWRMPRRLRMRRRWRRQMRWRIEQAKDSHDAGVGTNLDMLRAQVQLQTQQQAVINNENAFAKDKIALNRLIGLPADQEITLTDTAPYAEFAELPLADAMRLAFQRRKDLLSLRRSLRWRRRHKRR